MQPRPVPHVDQPWLEEEIVRMTKLGIIEPSISPWASPIHIVKRPGKPNRLVGDYSRLNDLVEGNCYPLPRAESLFNLLGKARFFSKLDLKLGFNQVPLTEESKKKTCLVSEKFAIQYKVMPFGIKTAPSVFQEAMVITLGPLLNKCVIVFIDDVLIYSRLLNNILKMLTLFSAESHKQAGLLVLQNASSDLNVSDF